MVSTTTITDGKSNWNWTEEKNKVKGGRERDQLQRIDHEEHPFKSTYLVQHIVHMGDWQVWITKKLQDKEEFHQT